VKFQRSSVFVNVITFFYNWLVCDVTIAVMFITINVLLLPV